MAVNVYSNTHKTRTKWRQILEDVLRDFDEGRFSEGMQFYTLEQFCAKYEISDITGRRVFNELRDRGLILSAGRRGTVVMGGTVAEDVYMCLPNAYFTHESGGLGQYHSFQQLSEGFSSGIYQRLFRVIPIAVGFLLDHRDNFTGKQVIVSAEALVDFDKRPGVLNVALLNELQETFSPIFFDSYGKLGGVTQVGVDFYRGIRKIVRHLVDRGHTRIGYFTHDVNDLWLQPRFKGFIDELFAVGIRFDPTLLLMTDSLQREENLQALHDYLRNPRRPTAVVCAHDARAIYVLEYCREHGISVPDDLAVTGFDNIPEAALIPIPLTTVDGMKVQIARKTLELLTRRRPGKPDKPAEIVIDPKLIVRASG
jgi:hypothetical protein